MTEEVKDEIREEKTEECVCKIVKKILIIALGSFLGCLVALFVFKAAVKPKFPPMPMKAPFEVQQIEHGKFQHHKGMRPEMRGKNFDGRPDQRHGEIPEMEGQELDRPPIR